MSTLSVPACLAAAQLTAFMNGVKNNKCCEAVAKKLFFFPPWCPDCSSQCKPQRYRAPHSPEIKEVGRKRKAQGSLSVLCLHLVEQLYNSRSVIIPGKVYSSHGRLFGITRCFCRECQPPGERAFQIWFYFFFKYVSNCFFTVWSLPFNDSHFYFVSFQHRPCPPSQYYNPPRSHPLCQVTQGEIVKDENPFSRRPVQMFRLWGLLLGGCRNSGHGSQKA